MGNRRMKHINELRVAAAAGNFAAESALQALLYVPHHLRTARKGIKPRTGYSGLKTNVYGNPGFKQGVHVTATTHKAVRSFDTVAMSPDYGLDRLQMLKDRRARA